MIWSRGINRVERDLGKRRGLLIVRVLVNRGTRPRRHAGPAKGLACQRQVLRTGSPGHELEGGILVAAALNHVQGTRPQTTSAIGGHGCVIIGIAYLVCDYGLR